MSRLAKVRIALLTLGALPVASPAATCEASQAKPLPVAVRVDARATVAEWRPIWRFFGYDEPNFTYMKDGQALLGELARLGSPTVYVRSHHLLTSGDGSPALKWGSTNVYTEDAQGRPVYDWTIVDRIFDTLLARGVKPFVEIGFMPEALSTRPDIYPHDPPPNERARVDGGQAYPPKDYDKWRALCREWVKHCVERYGRAEVESWWWEVWNEPNILYWKSTQDEYHKLYDYAIDGVRGALPTARVGGPHTAGGPGGDFLRLFLEHCLRGTNHATGKIGSPLDFIAFHAKGAPKFDDGRVMMGISEQLRNLDEGFAVVAAFPRAEEAADRDRRVRPRGLRRLPGAAARLPQRHHVLQLHGGRLRTRTTSSRTSTASISRARSPGPSSSRTSPGSRASACWRPTASPCPVLNVFRMMGRMGGQRLRVTSDGDPGVEAMRAGGVRGKADVSALASLDGRRLSVLLWHYHDDDVAGPDADVTLSLASLPYADGDVRIREYRIDARHSNAFERWKAMGSPQNPTPGQQAELAKASQLSELGAARDVDVRGGAATLRIVLPRQGVSLLVVEPAK